MKTLGLVVLLGARAAAGPVGDREAHVVPATGYAGAYLRTVALSLAADPFYGSRLLDSFELHLRSLAAMTAPAAVREHLEMVVLGAGVASPEFFKRTLGREPMDPHRAAALQLAHALACPEQFPEVLEGLEALKPGLGKQSARLLREAKGPGHRRLLEALRARGLREPAPEAVAYVRFSQLDSFWNNVADAYGGDSEIPALIAPSDFGGYGPDGRLRASGLVKPAP